MRRALLLAIAAVGLGGCGASGPVASEEISAAADRTASAGSSRISVVGDGLHERVTMEGVIDYDGRRASFDIDVESKDGEAWPGGEMRFIGTAAYMPAAAFGVALDETIPALDRKPKPWVSLDWSEDEPTLDRLVFPFPYIDPTRLFAMLDEVSGEVERLGSKAVRGVEVDGYRFEIDLRRAIAEAPAADREGLLEELERETRKSLPAEVWIDGDGYARRLFVVDGDEEVTLDFYDFGVPVEVQAPPADEVEDGDLLGWTAYGEGEYAQAEPGDFEELEDAPTTGTATVEEGD